MEKHFALIKNNVVSQVIVADDDFIKHIEKEYDKVIEVTDNRPHQGDSYYPKTNSFVSNHLDVNHIPSSTQVELNFKPFQLSKYTVTHKDGFIIVGCKKYSASGFVDALKEIVENKVDTTSHFTTLDGPGHGKFKITWADTQRLYDVIIKGQE